MKGQLSPDIRDRCPKGQRDRTPIPFMGVPVPVPEDGQVLRLPADKAADLVQAGDAVYVANSFQLSRRRENLSFSHHRDMAVCGLTPCGAVQRHS